MQPHSRVGRKSCWKALRTWENTCLPKSCPGLGVREIVRVAGWLKEGSQNDSRNVKCVQNTRTFLMQIRKRHPTIP